MSATELYLARDQEAARNVAKLMGQTMNTRPNIPMVRSSGLYLHALAGDGERFARLFASVWRRIPLAARRKMLSHWRSLQLVIADTGEPVRPWPHIELANCNSEMSAERTAEGMATAGQDSRRFGSLSFDSDWFGTVCDVVAESVIAHELAHVFQHATESATPTEDDRCAHELEADELASTWGLLPAQEAEKTIYATRASPAGLGQLHLAPP